MKIESADVHVEAQSKSELSSKAQTSFDFKQTLLGFVRKEADKPIQNEALAQTNIVEETQKKMEEERKLIQNEISKMILELILIQFLGINPKKAQSQAREYCQFGSSPKNEKPKVMVMKTEYNYERTIEYTKKDSVDFFSKALIKTEEKDIEIDLNVSYSKEFYEKHQEKIEFSEVSYIDPIVIQYSKEASSLDFLEEELTFYFDLDSNGEKDEIAKLKEGNGFLVLDKDKNGTIDNGSELFGPSTNDGFEELRVYDSDKNGWIDENDSIFKDLKIWTKDSNGDDKLFALGDSEIGAIYLKDANTDIDINKSVKDPLAHLKSTSFFVREDGSAGLLSSFDFVS